MASFFPGPLNSLLNTEYFVQVTVSPFLYKLILYTEYVVWKAGLKRLDSPVVALYYIFFPNCCIMFFDTRGNTERAVGLSKINLPGVLLNK